MHLKSAKITPTGIEGDREWFVLEKEFDIETEYTKDKRIVSITKSDTLGVVEPRFEIKDGEKYIVFSHPDQKDDLWINADNPPKDIVYEFKNNLKELVVSYYQGEEAEKWFKEVLNRDVVLCRSQQEVTADTRKDVYHYQFKEGDKRHAAHHHGALHIINEKSLVDLQSHIDEKVCKVASSMFRPNIVIDSAVAWDEDALREFEVEGIDTKFRVNYNSKRCKIANYEMDKKKKNEQGEPLNTLNKIKFLKGIGPIFGCFCQPDSACEIKVGDKVRYTKKVVNSLQFDTA